MGRALIVSAGASSNEYIAARLAEMGYARPVILPSGAVVFLVKAAQAEQRLAPLNEQGVLLLSKPFSNTLFVQAMHMAAASNHRLQRLRQENARLQDKISQIRLVSRAKCCLVEHEHLTEAEAHRRIEKLAMDTRRDRTEIAQEILDSYEDVGV